MPESTGSALYPRESTLYISDLDGTLLDNSAKLSDYSRDTLNCLIDAGLNFTVATARTPCTIPHILDGLRLNIPIVAMNGVCLYDLCRKKYEKIIYFSKQTCFSLIETVKKYGSRGFLYTIASDEINTYYVNLASPNAASFVEERVRLYNKKFTRLKCFYESDTAHAVYFSLSDRREVFEPLYSELCGTDGIRVEFYRDVYNDDFWYLEACPTAASKYNAVMYLREKYGFSHVVSFGDNLNDIPMFKASDCSYAVGNAKPEVKKAAGKVIGSNEEDGVAKLLKELRYC